MIKGSVHLEDIIILSEYVLNNRASKYTEQNLTGLQGETDKCTIIVKDIPLSVIDNKQTENQQGFRKLEQHYQPP